MARSAQHVYRALPFRLDCGKNALAQLLVWYQLDIARGNGEIGFGEHHIHVGEHGTEERPVGIHLAHIDQYSFSTLRPWGG